MSLITFFRSKTFRFIAIALGELIVLLVVFQFGLFVGFRKASFDFHWADAYNRNFGGPPSGFMHDFEGQQFFSGHGTAGIIIEVQSSTMIMKDQNNVEKIVNISPSTTIEQGHTAVNTDALKIDQRAVVIGAPRDDGSIDARMIRVFSADPSTASSTH